MTGDTPIAFDANKFELIHQVGGIRTATFDWPDAGGAPGCRVAMVKAGVYPNRLRRNSSFKWIMTEQPSGSSGPDGAGVRGQR